LVFSIDAAHVFKAAVYRLTKTFFLNATEPPADMPRSTLVRAIEVRSPCEQAYQQLESKLGLDRYERRSRTGLHHALSTMIAFGYL
jgi:SRSO17 transposase